MIIHHERGQASWLVPFLDLDLVICLLAGFSYTQKDEEVIDDLPFKLAPRVTKAGKTEDI